MTTPLRHKPSEHGSWGPRYTEKNCSSEVLDILNKYPRDTNRRPWLVDIQDIETDTEKFQLRKKEYSEETVERIITAVFKGELIKELYGESILWVQPDTKQIFILSGHSRLEAQKRLSTPPLCDDERVIAFQEKHGVRFDRIPSYFFPNIEEDHAKYIASISNVLGTQENLSDRLAFYIMLKRFNKHTDEELTESWATYEGVSEWNRNVLPLTYLNPNGKTYDVFSSVGTTGDGYKTLYTIAKWIGKAKMEIKDDDGNLLLNDTNETELFNWLVNHKGYGTRQGQINSEASFLDAINRRIAELQKQGKYIPGQGLNIARLKNYSSIRQNYERNLQLLRNQVREAKKVEDQFRKKILAENMSTDIESKPGTNLIPEKYKDQLDAIIRGTLFAEKALEDIVQQEIQYGKKAKAQIERMEETLQVLMRNVVVMKGKKEEVIAAEKDQLDLFTLLQETPAETVENGQHH